MLRLGWILGALVTSGLLLVSGCDGDDEATTVTETVPATTSTDTTAQGPTKATTTAESTPQDVGQFFYSPSRNIGCVISAESVGCAANEYSYEPPPQPAGCELEWGRSVGVTATGPGKFTCIGGLLAPPDSPTLEYGRSTSAGEISCDSSEAGIRCENTGGHGFLLARERVDVY
jgi:hypothetical protein